MEKTTKISLLFFGLMIFFSSHITCMEDLNSVQLKQELEKLAAAQRDNNILQRILSNMGDHTMKGVSQALADSISGSIVELVKRELDILYDGRPTIATQLNEIQLGLGIINQGIDTTTTLARHLSPALSNEEKEELNKKMKNELLNLYALRQEHIDQLMKIRQQRNPNYQPRQ